MMAEKTDRFRRLVRLLRELFQLDKPDLDFGFYRIMHAREAEVTRFLENDLLPQVKHTFQQYRSEERDTLAKQLAEAEGDARRLGLDPNEVPRLRELRKAINAGMNVDALEADVYDHLYRFFRRYYSEGDFISQRVYKDGVYAIPYQGEEVKLHWANADQYYIKTTQDFKDYSFRLHPEAERDPMRVHFRLADAAEGEHGNIKAANEKTLRFILLAEDFVAEEERPDGVRELVIRFEHRAATLDDWPKPRRRGKTKPPSQRDLNEAATTVLLDSNNPALARWIKELAAVHVQANGVEAEYSRLRSHLDRYTARNTCDYFIHKNLGGFLRRELDFYIKNEVMHLDDIEHASAPGVEQWLSTIRVIRAIAHKIIDFLHQLEGFQKKLWLKKKFVVETSWCVAVGSIPRTFHAEVAANRAQHDEWMDLHGIDNFDGDLTRTGYSDPPTSEFLQAYPTLMIDTRHFSTDFTERLLETIGGGGGGGEKSSRSLDELTDGVLFHSENFQALRLMEQRYRGRVDCVYIDPPYNTAASEILYKNGYRHSSWLSLMAERMKTGARCLTETGTQITAIDDTEFTYLRGSLIDILPRRDHTVVVVNHHPAGAGLEGTNISATHEYALFSTPAGKKVLYGHPKDKSDPIGFKRTGAAKSNLREGRPNSFYAVLVDTTTKSVVGAEKPPIGSDYPRSRTREGLKRIYPLGRDGTERVWRRSHESCLDVISKGELSYKGGQSLQLTSPPQNPFKPILSNWYEKKYNAGTRGTNLLKGVLGANAFSYPKSIHTVEDCVAAVTRRVVTPTILDYFAGSGTTAHATINLNREDGGQRRFILVEMAQYFDTVLLPRVKKVTFSPKWKNGCPARLATPEEAERSPRVVKVVRLESYEDTLNNLVVHRPDQLPSLLDMHTDGDPNTTREDYIIRYMLDVETGDSPSLLNLSAFLDPSAYHLKVKRPGSDESKEVAVDLLETFNWMLGLRVTRILATNRYDAEFGDVEESRTTPLSFTKTPAGQWWFRAVEGVLPDDRRALVIWRNRPGGDEPGGVERDNAVLDKWFQQSGYAARQADFDLIYANGDHNLDSLGEIRQPWIGHTIEDHFRRLMFEDAEEGT